MRHDVEIHIKQPSTWKRGGFILLLSLFYQMAAAVLFLIILFQFGSKLITGDTNAQLRQLSRSLTTYIAQIFAFMTYNRNDKPYPFGEWPEDEFDQSRKFPERKTDIEDIPGKTDPAADADEDKPT